MHIVMCQKFEILSNLSGFPLSDLCLYGICKKIWKFWWFRGGPSRFCVFPVICPKIQWKLDEKLWCQIWSTSSQLISILSRYLNSWGSKLSENAPKNEIWPKLDVSLSKNIKLFLVEFSLAYIFLTNSTYFCPKLFLNLTTKNWECVFMFKNNLGQRYVKFTGKKLTE